MTEFQDRVAIVTGAGRGIGRATALRLAREGARVVVNDLDEAECQSTADAIGAAGGVAVPVPGDITATDLPTRVVQVATDEFGRLDILVNNAGWVERVPIRDVTPSRWSRMLAIHVDASFRMLQTVGASFIAAHREERDRGEMLQRKIVNVSSVAGIYGTPGSIHYATAKAGVIGMTLGAAKEWGRYAININAIAFGLIETRLTGGESEEDRAAPSKLEVAPLDDQSFARGASSNALARAGTADEAAAAIRFLCSADANFVSGHTLVCAGGTGS
ncbi:3-oxoacyl-[acyl-carrier protein] reductase [Antricoccus suffuscus]|uniref:3-oxoacyl-[acyl-carrier protein] reductase n=1 Tax=Antricoccus suffuscus TaxID=1629062 RepID=A0A2T0ZEJ5_9ACTN|nr:SDR family oxidoreductase [Antricoccus suffuscus]PRZ34779.1 3-oxoacyl-[acyl-carrier protein] reductase [Antricoccus suffuscus]